MNNLPSGEGRSRPSIPELVINWHVTEACNYRCKYCYAQWIGANEPELIRDPAATERLLRMLQADLKSGAFRTAGIPIAEAGRLRLNFAGGEPLLFANQVIQAMQVARNIDLDVSLITNGSRLTVGLVNSIAPMLSILGLSIDAVDHASNAQIGRIDGKGRTPLAGNLAKLMALARQRNPALGIKVNTVVNARNWCLDMTPVIQELAPDQWKVLRMLPSTTTNLQIEKHQFDDFVLRHEHLRHLMRVEDNSDMLGSYLMIDPHGRYFQNGSPAFGYTYSEPILQTGASEAVKAIRWSSTKFAARYSKTGQGSPAGPSC